jgi:hypothetical protein
VSSCGFSELVFSLFCLRLRIGTVLYGGDVGVADVQTVSAADDMFRDAEVSSREEGTGGAKFERSSVESVVLQLSVLAVECVMDAMRYFSTSGCSGVLERRRRRKCVLLLALVCGWYTMSMVR